MQICKHVVAKIAGKRDKSGHVPTTVNRTEVIDHLIATLLHSTQDYFFEILGLWMADLTITQLFLETVDVTERGIVNGVQNAINQLLDLVKYAVVILLPVPEVFGYLVIISFSFICLGWTLFAVYVKKARGYLLPCSAKNAEHKM